VKSKVKIKKETLNDEISNFSEALSGLRYPFRFQNSRWKNFKRL